MVSPSELGRLRAEAKARLAAVNRKINRLKNNGVLIGGTEFDPRRINGRIGHYNSRQLATYIRDMNNFIDRRNQFVGGARGVPIPAKDYFSFQKTQREFNQAVEQHRSAFENEHVDQLGMTLGEAYEQMRSKSFVGSQRASNRPLDYSEFEASGFTSVEAMKKIQQSLIDKLDPGYMPARIAAGREELEKMLKFIGAQNLQPLADQLDDYQFNILWSEAEFADTVSTMYENVKNSNVAFLNTMEDSHQDAKELLEWATKLQRPAA